MELIKSQGLEDLYNQLTDIDSDLYNDKIQQEQMKYKDMGIEPPYDLNSIYHQLRELENKPLIILYLIIKYYRYTDYFNDVVEYVSKYAKDFINQKKSLNVVNPNGITNFINAADGEEVELIYSFVKIKKPIYLTGMENLRFKWNENNTILTIILTKNKDVKIPILKYIK